MPVVEFWPAQNSLPTDHPMHGGFDVAPWLAEADAVLVLDSLVPWIPSRHALPPDCPVIQIGPDPLFARPADARLPGDGRDPVRATRRRCMRCTRRWRARLEGEEAALAARRERIADAQPRAPRGRARGRAGRRRHADERRPGSATASIRSRARTRILFNELGADPAVLTFDPARRRSSAIRSPAASAGACRRRSAPSSPARERLVIAAVGDGSYMFANPVACHQVGEALGLPVLTVVFNNGVWNAVRKSTQAVYPDGHAVRANRMPLTSLEPAPRYEMIVAASGGYGERVEAADELPAALERALRRGHARAAPGAAQRGLPVADDVRQRRPGIAPAEITQPAAAPGAIDWRR